MTEYLAPVLRNQFNLFYRFGYTYIAKSTLIPIIDSISEEVKELLVETFGFLTPFEYDEEYVVLRIAASDNISSDNVLINIQDVTAVYPLSLQAKKSIESKIDPRIKLEQPIFEGALSRIEDNIEKKEIQKAIDALWHVCRMEGTQDDVKSLIGIDNILQGLHFRKKGIKASQITNANYWSTLIAYDRFDYFPSTTIGYFYDAGQVFGFSKGLTTFEGSELYKLLQGINPQSKFNDVIKVLESDERSKSYRSQTTNQSLRNYVVTPLFLMLKAEVRDAEDINATKLVKNIDYLKGFGDEFKAAVILLGSFFGFKKFYDLYYDKLNLRFFHSYTPSKEATVDLSVNSEGKTLTREDKSLTPELGVQTSPDGAQSPDLSIPSEIPEETKRQENLSEVERKEDEDASFTAPPPPLVEEDTSIELANLILEILHSKQDLSLTALSKELSMKTNKTIRKEQLKPIIETIPEIEPYTSKKTPKVRLKTQPLSPNPSEYAHTDTAA